MFKVIPEEHRKKFYIIFGILCVIAAISGGTLAWYTWQSSNNTTVSFTVEGVDVIFDAGADITSSKLRPVSTKEVGVEKGYAIEKTITASSAVTAYLNLYLTLEILPNGLKEESFIWEIYKDNALVGKGNFKDANQGDKITIVSNQKIESTTSTYKLYIWIDGENYGNPETMQNQTFKFVLNADATDKHPPATENIFSIFDSADKDTIFNNNIEYQYAQEVSMMEDVGGNIRYYGSNPNNYVKFNDELWRIIGVFNNIDDGTGNNESRIKIIRSESIGYYPWDSNGKNEWSTATLNTYLNGDYVNGLISSSQLMVDDALWELGGTSSFSGLYANNYYTFERDKTIYSGRSTEWIGKIALMYPSDYMYAGDLSKCSKTGDSWKSDVTNCRDTSWLRDINNDIQWTISPSSNSFQVFYIGVSGEVHFSYFGVTTSRVIRPVLYLKSTVAIIDGEGTSSDPYILSM